MSCAEREDLIMEHETTRPSREVHVVLQIPEKGKALPSSPWLHAKVTGTSSSCQMAPGLGARSAQGAKMAEGTCCENPGRM